MIIEAILYSTLILLAIGLFKKDSTITVFSGIMAVAIGLIFINSGVLDYPYSFQFGVLYIFFGLYIIFRSSIELIKDKKIGGE